ncbi:hypothetical protein DICPUDRAFT_80252 [Dictyostelium purpureum]|uniref:Structural maintenance of chromosomes protein n=1 Tax=Dictyostelium purpureum TaxID=5786 RepID=F0ZPY7_DICPU|nr:uncharacterized protein DICPUDRAFT_80252 [Dictyostelium purpureum]EGC33988.1 hypothetical protein DICPUDRAFT_80252 [Dictyostelium purpureum]|eukprot:XP_003289474.1 hypothetical protein DICPUDRAFT_80252 [Dictyostelium purpureum]
MGIRLLEICNFKSYRGKHLIGPFKDFSCVIGPNGSGKSNIMDAIIFVLGHKTAQIRGTKLSDLVNNQEDKDEDLSTYVEITFFHKGITYMFKRKIIGNGSKYYYSGSEVSYENFQGHLKEIGIDIATRNFFVFQGDVESIATQNPKQITSFIEEVSGSTKYVKEYNDLLSGKNKAEDDVFAAYAKRKTIAFEKEQYKEQWSEVKEYQTMQDGVDALRRDQQLAKLYYTTKEMRKEGKLLDESRNRIASINDEMKPTEAEYTATSIKQASLHKEVMSLEDELTRLAKSKKKGVPDQYKVEEEIKYITDKIKKAKTILKKAESNRNKQVNEIDQLREELIESTKKLEDLEKDNDIGGQALTKMDHAQIEEYNRLKLESGKETSGIKIQLDQLQREQKIDMDQQQALKTKLDEFNTMKLKFSEAQEKFIFQKETETEQYQDIEKQLLEAEKELNDTTSQFQEANSRHNDLNNKLEEIQYQLSESKSIKYESQRDRQFNQTVETLKSIFPGVRGKLTDLCEPSQRKYATALTLTMGKLMDAIVVDTEETLLSCVRYLKEQLLGVATFLSLDRLQQVKPVNQKLRQLGGTAKLLFDCSKIQKGAEEAVLYALGNTVVCESLGEAKMLAFGAERVKVITIQGIRITKSGLMSGGGLANIRSKAQLWDGKNVEALKKKRDAILAELSDVIQINDIFNKRQNLTSAVHELRSAFNLSKSKLGLIQERMKRNEAELETNRNAIETSEPELENLNKKIAQRREQIEKLQGEIRSIEENFFSDFSKKFGVDNIREYEDNRLAKIQENMQKRLELSESISNIKSRLDYEEGREIDSEIKQLNEEISNNENLLKEEMEQKEQNDEKIKKFNESFDKLKQDFVEKKEQLEKMNVTIKELRKQINTFNNQITDIEKLTNRHDFNLTKLRGVYHGILVDTRNEDIKLPILQYKGEDIKNDDEEEEEDGKSDKEGGKSDMSEGEGGKVGATSGSESEGGKRAKRTRRTASTKSGDEMESDGGAKKPTKPKKPTKKKVTKRKRENEGDDDDDEDIFNESDIESKDKPNLLQEIIKDIPQNASEDDILQIYEDEATILFSYSSLKKRVFSDQKAYEEFLKKLTIDIEAKNKEMKKVMPNYKAFEHLKEVSAKLTTVKKELDAARNTAKEVNEKFTEVREARRTLFMRAFKRIVKNLNRIYSELTRELEPPYHRGSAHLSLEDSVHPYNAGVKFTVIPPNKRFQEMEQLSGGEKSVAALAFLFSTHGLKSTPFMILDEIDAAFDSVNVLKLVRYVRQKASHDLQFLVISHKEQFFVHSDLLVGVCREIDSASKSFLLSLEEFPESDEAKKALLSKGDDETDDGKTSASSGSSESEDD